jgi:hypothetical protein
MTEALVVWVQPQTQMLTMPMPKLLSVPMTIERCQALRAAQDWLKRWRHDLVASGGLMPVRAPRRAVLQ